MAPVAALLGMDRTTLTAALKPLQRRGLIDVSADPSDRRSRRLQLTREGSAALRQAVPIWEATHGSIEQLLPEANASLVRMSLRALA
jgi:DNA-binding MarR family transcriptional regulator